MSIAAVRQGATNPSEIKTLMAKGVRVFWRATLHAKCVIAGRRLFTGSSNVSSRSKSMLDEAAIVTTESAAVERAKRFIRRMCTQPVTPEYLGACIEAYRPPRFPKARSNSQLSGRLPGETLWLVGGLRYASVSSTSRMSLSRVANCPEALVTELSRLSAEGLAPPHMALLLEVAADAAEQRLSGSVPASLVWSGPESTSSESRDTAVVVEELFANAERYVLVSSYVVQKGTTVFRTLTPSSAMRHAGRRT